MLAALGPDPAVQCAAPDGDRRESNAGRHAVKSTRLSAQLERVVALSRSIGVCSESRRNERQR